jgi:hypothetical protein
MAPKTRGRGRPTTGLDGKALSSYPRFTLRLPRPLMTRLLAMADVKGVPAWTLLAHAVEKMLTALPKDDWHAVEKRARQRQKTKRKDG